jgi:hypothetical protein
VADLLEFRRAQPRISRRRGGRTEFRDDADEDGMGVHGYEIPKPISPDLLGKPLAGRDLAASPNGKRVLKRTKREPIASPARRRVLKEASDAVLMTNKNKKGEKSAPLHDMTCLGIDTCSARSISCVIDDFLDLQDVENDKLRGVGGTTGVSGKGVMVIWTKDINDKTKIIIEPNATFIENPPAKYRLIGQMRMKEMGVPLTQDYDDKGTDILKCKRSGSTIPLIKGNGIQLLKTFRHKPKEELKEKIRSYVRRLTEEGSVLPHVVDLEELESGAETVLIMNEGNLKKENYERLLLRGIGIKYIVRQLML